MRVTNGCTPVIFSQPPGEHMAPAVEEILTHRIPEMRRAARLCAREKAAREVASALVDLLTRKRGHTHGAEKIV